MKKGKYVAPDSGDKKLAKFAKMSVKCYIKIYPSRGYGSGLFALVGTSENDTCNVLLDENGKPFEIYKVHCHHDKDTARATAALNRSRAHQ